MHRAHLGAASKSAGDGFSAGLDSRVGRDPGIDLLPHQSGRAFSTLSVAHDGLPFEMDGAGADYGADPDSGYPWSGCVGLGADGGPGAFRVSKGVSIAVGGFVGGRRSEG